jgi:hypothetical protein
MLFVRFLLSASEAEFNLGNSIEALGRPGPGAIELWPRAFWQSLDAQPVLQVSMAVMLLRESRPIARDSQGVFTDSAKYLERHAAIQPNRTGRLGSTGCIRRQKQCAGPAQKSPCPEYLNMSPCDGGIAAGNAGLARRPRDAGVDRPVTLWRASLVA